MDRQDNIIIWHNRANGDSVCTPLSGLKLVGYAHFSLPFHHQWKDSSAYLLVYCENGSVQVEHNDGFVRLNQGEYLIVKASDSLACASFPTVSWSLFVAYFTYRSPTTILTEKPKRTIIDMSSRLNGRENLFQEIYAAFQGEPTDAHVAYASSVLLNFIESELFVRLPCNKTTIVNETSSIVDKAIAYMHEHIQDRLDIEVLMKEAQCSRSTLFDNFNRYKSTSPLDYFLQMKMDLAGQMLLSTNKKVSDISKELGFSNAAHFTKLFTKMRGAAPTEFRKSK